MKTTLRTMLAVSCSLALVAISRGETLPEGASTPSTAEDVTHLVEQLDAPEFSQRQEASRKLGEAGRAVFPQVEKAAETGTREVASRGIEILRSHFQGGDDETKQAARASLERLAKSGNPAAAQRATEALTPEQQQVGLPVGNLNGLNPAIQLALQRQIQAAQAQRIQIGGVPRVAGIARRTTVRSINGKREVEHQEGDKTTKVRDGANGGIEAEITEKVNGKETTRKVEAKDLNDLKQKEPAAAEVYERYALRPAARPAAGTADSLKKQLESLDRTLETYKARLPNDPNVQRSIDSLKRDREQIEQRIKDAEAARPAAP
jgi:hypothetical protein